jgi:hypothetical protein
MKPNMLVWLAVCLGSVFVLSAAGNIGWTAGAVVGVTLVLAILLSVRRFRQERNLVRAVWRALTTRS